MAAHPTAETARARAHRPRRRITLADGGALRRAEDVFELLRGSTVGPRREFIVEESAGLDRDRIDA